MGDCFVLHDKIQQVVNMDFREAEKRIHRAMRKQTQFGAKYGSSMFHLTNAEQCWAKAFHTVLGVGMQFYINADAARRRQLEAHYTELAKHDTRKGRKAAKVVAARVANTLGHDEPKVVMEFDPKTIADLMKTTIDTQLVKDQMDAYRYLYGGGTATGRSKK